MTRPSPLVTAPNLEAGLPDEEATWALGRSLAGWCVEGTVFALVGPLAAGKTTLVQGLARGLAVPPEVAVRSPTFALCNEYRGRLLLRHLDLYRIASEDEAEEIGFREWVGSEGVAAVEWADLFPDLLPRHSLWLQLSHDGAARRVVVYGSADAPVAWLHQLSTGSPALDLKWIENHDEPPW